MILSLAGFIFFSMILLPSCSKTEAKDFTPPSNNTIPDRFVVANIAPGQTYSLTVDNVGQLSISRQASHFLQSVTSANETTGQLTYQYTPAAGFAGTDEVWLTHKTEYVYSSNSSCGFGSNSAIGSRVSQIAIRINVAQ